MRTRGTPRFCAFPKAARGTCWFSNLYLTCQKGSVVPLSEGDLPWQRVNAHTNQTIVVVHVFTASVPACVPVLAVPSWQLVAKRVAQS